MGEELETGSVWPRKTNSAFSLLRDADGNTVVMECNSGIIDQREKREVRKIAAIKAACRQQAIFTTLSHVN